MASTAASGSRFLRVAIPAALAVAICVAALVGIPERPQAIAGAIVGVCLLLWLFESVPSYVPTLLLWAAVPLFLGGYGSQYAPARVMGWAADPVMALFFGGFAFAVAASRYRIGEVLAARALGVAKGNAFLLVAIAMAATGFLSMWISNVAAAALMVATAVPLFRDLPPEDPVRRALLLGIAFGANFGGMGTPIGSGPNALAIAAMEPHRQITFLGWMAFAIPLTAGMMALTLVLIRLACPLGGRQLAAVHPPDAMPKGSRAALAVFGVCVAAWLSEPLHGVPAAAVSLAGAAALFGTRILDSSDLARIDWPTLLLIAGGLTMGRLLEESGLVRLMIGSVGWDELGDLPRLLLLCGASAFFSALISNTATVTVLLPMVTAMDMPPATAILIAISASMGVAFPISTPPNATAYGQGLRMRDIVQPGALLTVLGVLLVTLTGPKVLSLLGIR